MIRPVLADGRAPAAKAAVIVTAGILLGAWAGRGEGGALALAAAGAAGMVAQARPERRGAVFRLGFAAFWLAVGFASGRLRIARPAEAARIAATRLPADPGAAVVVEGVLSEFWSGRPPRARSVLQAERLELGGRGDAFPAQIVVFVSGESPVEPASGRGDRVRVTGRLVPEDLPASERELPLPWPRYTMSVKSSRMIQRIGPTLGTALSWPNRALEAAIPASAGDAAFERDVRGPLSALLLGRTSELDRGMVASYRRSGLYHLLVVSGLHVVLAAGLVLWALTLLDVRGKVRDLALLAAVFLFVLVGGANPPAVRAGVVVGVFLATRLVERPICSGQAAGLSALILFLAAPSQLFSIGTVLTFAAVTGIVLFSRPIRSSLPGRPEWLFSGLAVAVAAECATAPVLFWRFNVVAPGAWITAPVSVPLSGGLIALGGVLLAIYAAGIPAGPVAGLFALGSRALEWLAERSAALAFLRPTPPLAGIALVMALAVAAARGPRRVRRFAAASAAALFLVLILRRGPSGPDRGFSIEALDVGQGDAILLRWKRRAILVDGGGTFDSMATDFGRTRLLPKLLDRGVTRLDAALLTHPHPDHALGLFAVVDELPVGELWRGAGDDEGGLAGALEAAAARRRVPVRTLEALDRVEIEGATLTVLHSGGPKRKADAVNNQSVVAVFERDGRRAVLTGDAGGPTEDALIRSGAVGPADVLKVGHHGSRTSTSPPFVAAVRPRVALISCGRRNRYGHPSVRTLDALSAGCARVLRTDTRSDSRVELLPGATRLRWRGTLPP